MVFVRNMKKEDREQFLKNLIIQDLVVKECIFLQLIFKTNSSNMKIARSTLNVDGTITKPF